MKVLIYKSNTRMSDEKCIADLQKNLIDNKIEYEFIDENILDENREADCIFVVGGDGTILFVSEFAHRNSIPVIGINDGRIGFLAEFEKNQITDAVSSLKNKTLVEDNRLVLKIKHNKKTYYALNDVFIHRNNQTIGNIAADIKVEIDGVLLNTFKGDGAIVSTATGSSAYSFSLGGPLLSPDVKAFLMMPIAAHSFYQRPLIYSPDSVCKLSSVGNNNNVGIFVDGKFVEQLEKDESIEISCSDRSLVFLRKKAFDVFKRLAGKNL